MYARAKSLNGKKIRNERQEYPNKTHEEIFRELLSDKMA
jgi:hypothetical protein